jgi:hypothetical protein
MSESAATATLLDLIIKDQMSLLLGECTIVLRPGADIGNVRRARQQLQALGEAVPRERRTAGYLEATAATLLAAHLISKV